MRAGLKEKFAELWEKFFPGADLPIGFYYADEPEAAEKVEPPLGHRCLILDIGRVRRGESLVFDVDSVGCFGGKRYLGFAPEITPNFEFFLSYGIPGKLEGERYLKSPELVREAYRNAPTMEAPTRNIVFKRWDKLDPADEPLAVVFFAQADVVSGLFTLANFDDATRNAVICPFGAGCATIVQYPCLENEAERPRAVLGTFDVSARPCVPPERLTFAVPMRKFERMVDNMEESFLITPSWEKVRKRIRRLGRDSG